MTFVVKHTIVSISLLLFVNDFMLCAGTKLFLLQSFRVGNRPTSDTLRIKKKGHFCKGSNMFIIYALKDKKNPDKMLRILFTIISRYTSVSADTADRRQKIPHTGDSSTDTKTERNGQYFFFEVGVQNIKSLIF